MKLLKFDTLYPANFIEERIANSLSEVESMDYREFHQWLISLRMNFSDFYTYNLSLHGWDAREIFLDNKLYKKKCERYYFGILTVFHKALNRFWNLFREEETPFKEKLIERIIRREKPDVIFVREQSTIRSIFWEKFKKEALLVSRLDCGLPRYWSPFSFDLIYTNIESFDNFFKANHVPVLSNSNGFDSRVLSEVLKGEKLYEVVFIGGLGSYHGFIVRSKFLEELLARSDGKFKFSWWGYKTGNFDLEFPELARNFNGVAGGLDMLKIYANSKIVINDYGAGVGGAGVNQRIFEVLGASSLLLTRESETLKNWEPYLATYSNVNNCLENIIYFLTNEEERETVAKRGQEYVLKNFNYKDLMKIMSDQLMVAYNMKFKQNISL